MRVKVVRDLLQSIGIEMEFSEKQNALLALRATQLALEEYQKNEAYPPHERFLIEELEGPGITERLAMLELSTRAGDNPMEWLVSGDGWRTLQRLLLEMLPLTIVTLTENDRDLLQLMLSLDATSPANPKPADFLMSTIGGDHKKAFKRLKAGGYAMSGHSGWCLTWLGKHTAQELKRLNQNGTD